MKTMKILPWIARKAGVPEARAAELWAEAIRHATAQTGWVGTSDYWGVALDRWMALIEAEKSLACKDEGKGDTRGPGSRSLNVIVPQKHRDASARGAKAALPMARATKLGHSLCAALLHSLRSAFRDAIRLHLRPSIGRKVTLRLGDLGFFVGPGARR